MMYEYADILEAARAIRPHLSELVGTEAAAIDQQLTALIARAEAGEAIDQTTWAIMELLRERDATRERFQQLLTGELSPLESFGLKGGFAQLAGSQSVVHANRFVCEVAGCSEVWHRPKAGIAPPSCSKHQKPLVPAPRQTP